MSAAAVIALRRKRLVRRFREAAGTVLGLAASRAPAVVRDAVLDGKVQRGGVSTRLPTSN